MNGALLRYPILAALLLLTAVASLRSAEYDEQYTLFLTAGTARPIWPDGVLTAGQIQAQQTAQASLADIARDLRRTDVHPPLYFWIAEGWRRVAGGGLFTLRMLSVLFSLVTLALVGAAAQRSGISALAAISLTLGCYGFAYTGAIARGFALAQMLSVAGIALLLDARGRWQRTATAGILFGAATFTNYLAALVACAGLLHSLMRGHRKSAYGMIIAFAIWLPADLWFFLAQRQSRNGQFAPFEPIAALTRLAQYSAATLFGGLPLYVSGAARAIVVASLGLAIAGIVILVIRRWHQIATPQIRMLLAMAAAAPPIGLLILGFAFHNTPIELRYLAFPTPFIGLLVAGALPRSSMHVVLAIQALALLGLTTRSETMQPARATAIAAASLVHDGVVLLPLGNDGVGIVGAFAVEAPPNLRIILVKAGEQPEQIRERVSRFPRVVLALMGQDEASRMALPAMREAFDEPCWRMAAHALDVVAFDRICMAR